MTENKGDLISREALKKAIIEHRDDYVEDNFFWSKLFNLIDNAPTVEPCKDCEDRKQAEYIRHSSSWHELQALRKFKEEHDRPQGEWVFISRNCWKCPICNELTNEGKNFCPNCGASMKKGGAE